MKTRKLFSIVPFVGIIVGIYIFVDIIPHGDTSPTAEEQRDHIDTLALLERFQKPHAGEGEISLSDILVDSILSYNKMILALQPSDSALRSLQGICRDIVCGDDIARYAPQILGECYLLGVNNSLACVSLIEIATAPYKEEVITMSPKIMESLKIPSIPSEVRLVSAHELLGMPPLEEGEYFTHGGTVYYQYRGDEWERYFPNLMSQIALDHVRNDLRVSLGTDVLKTVTVTLPVIDTITRTVTMSYEAYRRFMGSFGEFYATYRAELRRSWIGNYYLPASQNEGSIEQIVYGWMVFYAATQCTCGELPKGKKRDTYHDRMGKFVKDMYIPDNEWCMNTTLLILPESAKNAVERYRDEFVKAIPLIQ